jgi:hypothetical protein
LIFYWLQFLVKPKLFTFLENAKLLVKPPKGPNSLVELKLVQGGTRAPLAARISQATGDYSLAA